MLKYNAPFGDPALAVTRLGAIVTETPGAPSPVPVAQRPATGFASADPAAVVASAQVRVSGHFRSGAKHQDLFAPASAESGTFTGTGAGGEAIAFDRATGVPTLSGGAGAHDEAFEALRFAIVGDDPDDGGTAAGRTIAYSTLDGAAFVNAAEASLGVAAANDAPTLQIIGLGTARLGGETVVDPAGGGVESVTALADGGYLMTWARYSNVNQDRLTFHTQRFDVSGAAVGAGVVVADAPVNSVFAGWADGGFILSWEASGKINSQRYDASGAKQGGHIASYWQSGTGAYDPSVSALTGGGFVVTWSSGTFSTLSGGGPSEIYAQRYDAAGATQGPVRVNTFTANSQYDPSSVGLADGGYVIVWISWSQDGFGPGIYGQRFNAAGIAQGGEFRINTTTDWYQHHHSVTALADGGFIVGWISDHDRREEPHVYVQRFDGAGNVVGGETKVSGPNSPAVTLEPVVTDLADGGFVVAWVSLNRGYVYARRYGADGEVAGPDTRVNSSAGQQGRPALAGLAGGDFVVGWGSDSGIVQQRYTDGFAVFEGFALVLGGMIDLDDVDVGTGAITVTLGVEEGSLYYAPLPGNAAVVTGDGTSTLRITGSLADVKAYLGDGSLISYQNDNDAPPANVNLTVRVEESGNGGDPLAAETSVVIGIVPVNDLPVLSAPTSEILGFTEGDGPLALMQGVTVSDPDLPAYFRYGNLTLSVTGATGALQLRQGSDFQLTVDAQGNHLVSHQNGGSPVTVAYLVGLGTRSVSAEFYPVMTPDLASDLIDDFVFTDSSDNSAAGNRTATLTFFDGPNTGRFATPGTAMSQTITVTPVNDAPVLGVSRGTGLEDDGRVRVELAGSDPEGTLLTYTLASLPQNGLLYSAYSGGSPLASGAVLTGTASGLLALYFQPDSNWSGSTGFDFTVSDGNATTGPATATINVIAANDVPQFSIPPVIHAVEQTQVALLAGVTVSDVELDPRNGGAGDYSGSILTVQRGISPANPDDQFALVAGAGFTIDGNDLKAGGLIFGKVTGNSNGVLSIAFTGAETPATRALVNEVLQAVRYTNVSDGPPSSLAVHFSLDDGGVSGQGHSFSAGGVVGVWVNIAGVNDGPVVDMNGAAAGATNVVYTENGAAKPIAPAATIVDPDSANFAQGQLLVTMGQSAQPYDRLEIVPQGSGPGQIGISASGITYGGTLIATRNGGGNPTDLVFTFTASATPAAVQALVRAVGYRADTDTPATGSRPILFTLTDGDGGTASGNASLTILPVDDPAVARDDSASTAENALATGNVFLDSGSGADSDVDGGALAVSAVNGNSIAVGQAVILASGARLTLNADGSYVYDPNGRFDSLTGASSGAVNTSATDSFTYSLAGGGSATVTVTVAGVAGPGDRLSGDSSGNFVTGTPGADIFHIYQGGDDTVLGGEGNDNIFFIGSLTAADVVDGGDGVDTLILQGPYGSLALSADVTRIENVSLLAGNNINFGEPGSNRYDYVLTTNDANFAAGVQARINGAALLEGEDFTFDGSAETDAKYVVYGGKGRDILTGGLGNDIFFYAEERFASGDVVDGGSGYDGMFLRGNYTIDFTAPGYTGLFTSIENLTLTSATDERYARGGGTEFDYNLILSNAIVKPGEQLTISGTLLMASETMILDAGQEADGLLRLFGGKADDILKGGGQADLLHGNLGSDILAGNGGADTFRYDTTAESNSASRDQILDFTPGTDKIDLSRIDASTLAAGDQAFSWIGSNAFSGQAGQLRAYQQGGTWFVEGDVNGDGAADLVIALTLQGPTPLSAGDFLL